jgi:membrane protein
LTEGERLVRRLTPRIENPAIFAVIGLMMWMWLSAVVSLAGAKLNAEIEHQTAIDSTIGPPKPLGERGAVMADTVGKAIA